MVTMQSESPRAQPGPQARRQTATVPVVNPKVISPADSRPFLARPHQPKSNAIYIAGGLFLLFGILTAGLFVYLGGRPGELVVTSEPAAQVRLIVDDKKLAVDGTPATIVLDPGAHQLRVERDGYVAHQEALAVAAGSHQKRHIVLELVPSNAGFKLMSEPPGAEVWLDGKLLNGVTPLQAQGLAPGKHKIELKSAAGTWSQEVTLEPGGLAEIRAVMPGSKPAPPVVAAPPVAKKDPVPLDKLPRLVPPEVSKPEPVAAKPEPVAKPKPEPVAARPRPEPRPEPVAKPKPEPIAKAEPAPKPVAKAEPMPKAGGKEGFLRLNSKPWTNISVDGKDTGLHTPQTQLKLAAGSHKITLSNPQFNIKETFTVEIRAGETETVIKDLRQPEAGED